MSQYEYVLIGTVFGFFIAVWLASTFIRYLRSKRHNRELWGTIFEGATHKLINLDAIKEPEVFIEKKLSKVAKVMIKTKTRKRSNRAWYKLIMAPVGWR